MSHHTKLKKRIETLIGEFRKNPNNFFHEKEIHSRFFCLCRDDFGKAKPKDSKISLNLFRQEYDTIWRYKRKDNPPFDERYTEVGTPACIDFVILKKKFVKEHDLLTVINKDEDRRKAIRPENISNPAIDVGIEFKMSHWTKKLSIEKAGINQLEKGLLEDCRKLAQECIPDAYIIAFSHEIDPKRVKFEDLKNIAEECERVYTKYNSKCNPKGNIYIDIITPKQRLKRKYECNDQFNT